jgi:glycosyltransferase involved in cell wall biosynthesis
MPRVSVVVPAYNSAAHIRETLEGALAQTHADREVIVVDDGSTDGTGDVVASFGSVVQYLRQPNAGVGAARNHGFRLSTGDFLAFLDADDIWSPDFLARSLDVLARNPQSGLSACDGVQFAGDRVAWPHTLSVSGEPGTALFFGDADEITGDFYRAMIRRNFIATPGQVVLPRAAFERCGPFDDRRGCSEDWDLWLRIARAYPITFHRASLIRYRLNPDGISGAGEMRELRWNLRRRRRLAPDYREPLVYLLALHAPDPLVTAVSRALRVLGLRGTNAAV